MIVNGVLFSRQVGEEHGVLVLIGHGHRFLVPVGPMPISTSRRSVFLQPRLGR
jgi:hypothetical protein